MGVKGLKGWLLKKFLFTFVSPRDFTNQADYICFDLNSSLHEIGRKTWHQFFLFQHLNELFQSLGAYYRPNGFFIGIDGSAPVAKLKKQLRRRKNVTKTRGFDPVQLTPGTLFMYDLKDHLLQFGNQLNSINEIHLSCSDCAGEAELKLIKFIKEQRNSMATYLIVGEDSDLFLLAMCSGSTNTNVLTNQQTLIFSTNLMLNYFTTCFPSSSQVDKDKVAIDFVLTCILMGNDYLPKIQGLRWGNVWRRYIECRCTKYVDCYLFDTDKETINVSFLTDLLNLSTSRDMPVYDNDDYDYDDDSEDEYEEGEFEFDQMEHEEIDNTLNNQRKVTDYLSGLIWNMRMYIKGECHDHTYHYRHVHAPSISHFNNWISNFNNNSKVLYTTPFELKPGLSPAEYALILVPFWGKEFLPEPLHDLIIDQVIELDEEEEESRLDFELIKNYVSTAAERWKSLNKEELSELDRSILSVGHPISILPPVQNVNK